MQNNQRGFTIMEFLIAITVLGIITSLAVPAFVRMTEVFGVDGKQRNLIGAIKFAQAEAIKRNRTVSVCVAHSSSADTCSSVGTESWTQGWHIFLDADNDRAVDVGEEIFRSQAALSDVSVASTPATQNALTFDGSGALTFGAGVTFDVCDKDSTNLDCSDTDEYTNGFSSLISGQIVPRKRQ